ncbi:invasion associated locus B family protein [Martelella radicis]|uniref:Invasion protein IalB n=1 Tax=Martelella radicis TaxID=1397476 RepID=A0A7W6KLW5_9HYPH|nr:invasion associated locus B family protein [Martelella radicis]MBB4122210.1 invasion protein IalB [Martelella radicis]
MPTLPAKRPSRAIGAAAGLALSTALIAFAPFQASAQESTGAENVAPPTEQSIDLGDEQDPTMVRENHGAWSMICDQPPGATLEQCALMQNVIADDRPEIGLSIAVLKTADRQATLLRVLSPLGVFLPEGMGLFVDGINIGKAAYSRCYLDGCYVEVDIDEDLMKILRAGTEAVFTLNFSIDQDTIGIPVDLSGFGEGFDALP